MQKLSLFLIFILISCGQTKISSDVGKSFDILSDQIDSIDEVNQPDQLNLEEVSTSDTDLDKEVIEMVEGADFVEIGCESDDQCPEGYNCCDGVCIDIQLDPENCGGCGIACSENENCCGGICTDLKSDINNCGDCGVHCEDPPSPFPSRPGFAVCGTAICLEGSCSYEISSRDCMPGWQCMEDGYCHAPCLTDDDCIQTDVCSNLLGCDEGFCQYLGPIDCSLDDSIERDYYISCSKDPFAGLTPLLEGYFNIGCRYYPKFYVPYPRPELVRPPFGRYSTQIALVSAIEDAGVHRYLLMIGDSFVSISFSFMKAVYDVEPESSLSISYDSGSWRIDGETQAFGGDDHQIETIHLTTDDWLVFYGIYEGEGIYTFQDLGPFCAAWLSGDVTIPEITYPDPSSCSF